MSDWSHSGLWAKAVLYATRATEEERSSPLYPLWATLSLEFLARACLAKIHPVLLADATGDENVLHACGYPMPSIPRSIAASKVFKRCRLVINGFTEDDSTTAMKLIERRNAELHSGTSGFAGFGTESWLADYFRICRMLLNAQEKSLTDLLGKEEAIAAETMIAAAQEKVIGQVKKSISEAKKRFEDIKSSGVEDIQKAAVQAVVAREFETKEVDCPACGHKSIVRGERISTKKSQLDDETGTINRRVVILPTFFDCSFCKLFLRGHAALHAAGLGGTYEVLEPIDPAEYFGFEGPTDDEKDAYVEEWLQQQAADAQEPDYEDQ